MWRNLAFVTTKITFPINQPFFFCCQVSYLKDEINNYNSAILLYYYIGRYWIFLTKLNSIESVFMKRVIHQINFIYVSLATFLNWLKHIPDWNKFQVKNSFSK